VVGLDTRRDIPGWKKKKSPSTRKRDRQRLVKWRARQEWGTCIERDKTSGDSSHQPKTRLQKKVSVVSSDSDSDDDFYPPRVSIPVSIPDRPIPAPSRSRNTSPPLSVHSERESDVEEPALAEDDNIEDVNDLPDGDNVDESSDDEMISTESVDGQPPVDEVPPPVEPEPKVISPRRPARTRNVPERLNYYAPGQQAAWNASTVADVPSNSSKMQLAQQYMALLQPVAFLLCH
jgi:hypothetical protein